MSNDSEKNLLLQKNISLSNEVYQRHSEIELLRLELSLIQQARDSSRLIAQNGTKRIRELEAQLAEAQATIASKDGFLIDWMASQRAFKRLAKKLAEEGQAHPDKQAHPLANSTELRQQIVNTEKAQALQDIRDGKF